MCIEYLFVLFKHPVSLLVIKGTMFANDSSIEKIAKRPPL